jgi:WD40 repeat protein
VQLCSDLLAVSPDGKLLVFGGARHRATVRRAPDYATAALGDASAALSAAFSSDGAWIVTGHADGHLELWEVKTLRSRLTIHPPWHPED